MIDWLAANEITLMISSLISLVILYAISRYVIHIFRRTFDPDFRELVIRDTAAVTDDQIAGFYIRAMWKHGPLQKPFFSRSPYATATRYMVVWAWIFRFMIWTTVGLWVAMMIAPTIERLGIRDLNLNNFEPVQDRAATRYHVLIDLFFLYLRFVIHASYGVIAANIIVVGLVLIYVSSPCVRAMVRARIAKVASRIGFE